VLTLALIGRRPQQCRPGTEVAQRLLKSRTNACKAVHNGSAQPQGREKSQAHMGRFWTVQTRHVTAVGYKDCGTYGQNEGSTNRHAGLFTMDCKYLVLRLGFIRRYHTSLVGAAGNMHLRWPSAWRLTFWRAGGQARPAQGFGQGRSLSNSRETAIKAARCARTAALRCPPGRPVAPTPPLPADAASAEGPRLLTRAR
jgi:hypothetical protein